MLRLLKNVKIMTGVYCIDMFSHDVNMYKVAVFQMKPAHVLAHFGKSCILVYKGHAVIFKAFSDD